MSSETLSPELLAEIKAARRSAAAADRSEPRASDARFDLEGRTVKITLAGGGVVSIATDLIQGLQTASDHDLAQVEITPSGSGLHWEALDVDISVPALVRGTYGTRAWMAQLGQIGGRTRTEAKAAAARENGKKGGRPSKETPRPAPRDATGARATARRGDGRTVRLPRALWETLAEEARREDVSLDVHVASILSERDGAARIASEVTRDIGSVSATLEQLETQINAVEKPERASRAKRAA